jgi:hypothetical protein
MTIDRAWIWEIPAKNNPKEITGMKYLLHHTWRSKRGKGSETLEDIKAVNVMFASMGNTSGRIYVDVSGTFDMVVWDVEVDSLDGFYKMHRQIYAEPPPEFARLVAHENENTVTGSRDIYEVIL